MKDVRTPKQVSVQYKRLMLEAFHTRPRGMRLFPRPWMNSRDLPRKTSRDAPRPENMNELQTSTTAGKTGCLYKLKNRNDVAAVNRYCRGRTTSSTPPMTAAAAASSQCWTLTQMVACEAIACTLGCVLRTNSYCYR